MIRRVITCCFVLAFFFSSQISAQEKSPPGVPLQIKAKPEALIAHLQQRIPQLMQDGEVPALAIALIREGKLVWHHSFGFKNAETKEPVTDSTVFEAASLSKPVFAYAVLKLNVEDYPQSFNVYDSLGEAYMVNNEKELAMKNYQKSLELNPNNTSGVEMLKKLQGN